MIINVTDSEIEWVTKISVGQSIAIGIQVCTWPFDGTSQSRGKWLCSVPNILDSRVVNSGDFPICLSLHSHLIKVKCSECEEY